MRRLTRAVAIAALFELPLTASVAPGQITFDENGHGFGPSGALPFIVGPDPLSGIVTLKYGLPFPVFAGDLVLSESDNPGVPSDILRFYMQSVFFFSERESGDVPPFDLADVATLPVPQQGFVSLVESGPEGNNGVVWIPPAGAPGASVGSTVQYNIISDGVVPEPSGIMLTFMGAMIAIVARKVIIRDSQSPASNSDRPNSATM